MHQEGRLQVLEDGQLRKNVGALKRSPQSHPAGLMRLHASDVAVVDQDPLHGFRTGKEQCGGQTNLRLDDVAVHLPDVKQCRQDSAVTDDVG